ncbi:5'-AMP-activated protein kinase subunit gamma-3 like [Heracleum sosnowskyi]|uniref:5'-AMP-activated protein kinase subunit gamma-3 like n=1 Tax=Heracleum sosnowskyi TaxID=360622 RepID=A0AAD8IIU1_9APIA|nr:5'-AMP-activated protein kinase subunit gamma-3 like [Heracleum sosnowskyi]
MERRDGSKQEVESNERWSAAMANITGMSNNLQSLQNLLVNKAVYVDDDTFFKASLTSQQARTIKILEQRVENLERELDAAISASAHARTEKRQAEAGQKAAELRAQEITRELENTTKVFELHMEELRAKQEEISKRDKEIKLLEAIIQTLGGKSPSSTSG